MHSFITQIYSKFALSPSNNPEIKARYAYQGYAAVCERLMRKARKGEHRGAEKKREGGKKGKRETEKGRE